MDSKFVFQWCKIILFKVGTLMELKLNFILCWLGIHRYKVIDISFGFGPSGSIKTIQCKICGIKKTRKG